MKIKKTFIAVSIMLFVSVLFFYQVGFSQTGKSERIVFSGDFLLKEGARLRVSIDRGWERNGQVPVVLTFNELEIIATIDAAELPTAEDQMITKINNVFFEGAPFPFKVYEQNALRTRLELTEGKPVQLKINEQGQVEFLLGGSRLKLDTFHAVFREIKNTQSTQEKTYELDFIGSKVISRNQFTYVPSKDSIYVASRFGRPSNLSAAMKANEGDGLAVWAVKGEIGKGNTLNQDKGK
ncbi:MAG: hypothetical protein ACM3SY_11145 [Candidatus Omnitrophota bacterium]